MNKPLCYIPWSHLHFSPDGNIFPCCKLIDYNKTYLLGTVKDKLENVWNSEVYKKIRKELLNGTPGPGCSASCFRGKNPYYMYVEKNIINNSKDCVKNTLHDGTAPLNLIALNVAESNFCNFICTYCNHQNSSSWYNAEAIINGKNPTEKIINAFNNLNDFKNYYDKIIDTAEYFSFASGETFFSEGNVYILKELIRRKRNDKVKIMFITNLSNLNYKNLNILNYLSEFSDSNIIASIDTYGKREEYIRFGTKWDLIEKNRIELLKHPNIKFFTHSVVTNLSISSLPNFHYDWFKKGFLKKDNLRYIILEHPEYLHVRNIPNNLKQQVIKDLQNYKQFLSDYNTTEANRMSPSRKIDIIIDEINRPTYNLNLLKEKLTQFDDIKKLNYREIFPELIL